jgi:hypothetical protein
LFPRTSNRVPQTWQLSMQAPFGQMPPEISPDGSSVLTLHSGRLQLRRLDSLKPVVLANGIYPPVSWSPDGRSVLAFSFEGRVLMGSLKKILIPDGVPETLATFAFTGFEGATWGSKGTILFAAYTAGNSGGGLFVVPAAGGQMRQLPIPNYDGGGFFRPEFLPNGEDFLFTWMNPATNETGIYLAAVREEKLRRQPVLLRKTESAGRFSPAAGGQLLFVAGDRLYAQHLNVSAGRLDGEQRSIVDDLFSFPSRHSAHFSTSWGGMLAWRQGQAYRSQLTWFDRSGRVLGTTGPPGNYIHLRISPDGSKVVAGSLNQGAVVMDASERGGQPMPRAVAPLWLSNDRLISDREGGKGAVSERSLTNLGDDKEISSSAW